MHRFIDLDKYVIHSYEQNKMLFYYDVWSYVYNIIKYILRILLSIINSSNKRT